MTGYTEDVTHLFSSEIVLLIDILPRIWLARRPSTGPASGPTNMQAQYSTRTLSRLFQSSGYRGAQLAQPWASQWLCRLPACILDYQE